MISILLDFECYEKGSLHGYEHDQTTGTCTCNSGFQGYICQGKNFLLLHSLANIHMMKYIYFSSTDMQCPGDGTCSNQGICDISTGSCTCNPGIQGDMCQGKNSLQLTNVH